MSQIFRHIKLLKCTTIMSQLCNGLAGMRQMEALQLSYNFFSYIWSHLYLYQLAKRGLRVSYRLRLGVYTRSKFVGYFTCTGMNNTHCTRSASTEFICNLSVA